MRERFHDACIALTLFALNLLIAGPFLLTDFSDQPWNNGYIYIAISRMFRDSQWTWNPRQYGGAPFRYIYPPVFHVLAGLIPVHSIGRAVHILTAIGYALVPVCLYILARTLFGSRMVALFAAVAYSVFPSPAYAMTVWRDIAKPYAEAPWGFVALIAYDEAAHAFAFPFALLAIAAAWRNRWLTAALCAAVVFLTNWPALIGLCLLLVALAVARRELAPVVGVGGIAYGLAAFWMTPGYFVSSSLLNRIVLRHTLTAAPFTTTTWLILIVAAAMIGVSFWRRIPPAIALVLTWVAITGAVVVSFTITGSYLLPSPHRYMLEFNAGCVLAVAALVSLVPSRFRFVPLLIGLALSWQFIAGAWKVQPPGQDPTTGVAYQIAQWLNKNAGQSRVLASGELDSTLPLWSDVPQVGGSGQDVSNFMMWAAERQVAFGCRIGAEPVAELWLRALNVRYLVVHEAASREYFHWYADPERFRTLPVAWDNGAGDKIYQLPGGPEAVVVDMKALRNLPPMKSTADAAFLEAYVAWSAGKRPARASATLGPDEAVLVKSNYDPGWHASGAKLEPDPIGYMIVHGDHTQLQFGASWETWLGRGITALVIVLLFLRVRPLWIAAVAILPAAMAYAVLLPRSSPEEEAFIRLQPPLINPGGIVDAGPNLVTVYAFNLGSNPHVWLDDHEAEVVSHSPQNVTFRLPPDATAKTAVSIESNGCRGNAFSVGISPRRLPGP